MTTEEIKQQARKEFDEELCNRDKIGLVLHEEQKLLILSFIDSLIDKTVQFSENRIVGIIEDYRKIEWLNLHDRKKYKEQIEMRDTIDKIISLITNKSDINK